MKLVNLTPYDVVVQHHDGTVVTVPASGHVARLDVREHARRVLDITSGSVAVHTISYGAPTALPDPEPGTVYIVARIIADHCARPDLLFPDDEIRDDCGRILAVRRLARLQPDPSCRTSAP